MKMLSTMSNPLTTQSVERKQKDGSKVMVPCPDAVVVYNKFMGGVDKGDQLRHYYRIRTNKRTKVNFVALLHLQYVTHVSTVVPSELAMSSSSEDEPRRKTCTFPLCLCPAIIQV